MGNGNGWGWKKKGRDGKEWEKGKRNGIWGRFRVAKWGVVADTTVGIEEEWKRLQMERQQEAQLLL